MNAKLSFPARLLSIALLAASLGACAADDQAATDALEPSSALVAPEQAPIATVLLKPGSQYFLDGEQAPLDLASLQTRLGAAAARSGSAGALRLLAEPGVVGYDVVMVSNAAQAAGIRRIDGVADYVEGKAEVKRWSQELPMALNSHTDQPLPH